MEDDDDDDDDNNNNHMQCLRMCAWTYLLVALEYRTLECIGATISGNIAKYLEIATVVWYVKYSINRVLHQLHCTVAAVGSVWPLLLFLAESTENEKSGRTFQWVVRSVNQLYDLTLTFRFFFFSSTLTPSMDIWMVTFCFLLFCTLHSYWSA